MKEERHVIWSNYGLDYEDWRDDLEAEYPDLSENERISLMYEINGDYLDDERANLNSQLPHMGRLIYGYVKGAVFFYVFLRFRSHRTGKAGGPAHLPANLRTPGAGPCVRQRLLYQDP